MIQANITLSPILQIVWERTVDAFASHDRVVDATTSKIKTPGHKVPRQVRAEKLLAFLNDENFDLGQWSVQKIPDGPFKGRVGVRANSQNSNYDLVCFFPDASGWIFACNGVNDDNVPCNSLYLNNSFDMIQFVVTLLKELDVLGE